jgi:hypothetical protein
MLVSRGTSCSQVDFSPSPSDVHRCFSAGSGERGRYCPASARAFKYLTRYFRSPLSSLTTHTPQLPDPFLPDPSSCMWLWNSTLRNLTFTPRPPHNQLFPPRRVIADRTDTPSRCSLIGYFQGANPSTSQSPGDLNNILHLRE